MCTIQIWNEVTALQRLELNTDLPHFLKSIFHRYFIKKIFFKKCTCYLYYLSLCLGRKMNMVWARYTNLVKVERLLDNQNRKWCIYYMYHYVLNINVYHIHYVCIILFITDTRNRKYMILSLSFLYVLLFEVSLTCLSIGIFDRTFCRFIWLICDIFVKDKVLVMNALSIKKKKNAPMQRYWSSFVFLPNCFLYLNLNTGGIFMGESTHKINHRVPVNILFCYVNQCHCVCSHTCSSFRYMYIFETIAIALNGCDMLTVVVIDKVMTHSTIRVPELLRDKLPGC